MTEDPTDRVRRSLSQLRDDLGVLLRNDPDQELLGVAVPVIERALDEAREVVQGPVAETVYTVLPPGAFDSEDSTPLRASDVLVMVGQLLAALPPAQLVF